MTHLHPGFALALLIEAFLVLWVLLRWIRLDLVEGHAPTIDGLRGFLAFGVFVHHASIWYTFLQTGVWNVPASRLYTHLGQSTVSLFFMITGFLFFGKVLESRRKPIDWLRLYVSRCLRILPLYLLVIFAGILVIALIRYSGWVQPMPKPWHEKSLTGLFTAGVTWTLGYEWKFYYALPLLALTVGRVQWQWITFAIAMLVISGAGNALGIHAAAFVSGVIAALLSKVSLWKRWATSAWGSVCALSSLVLVVTGFDTAYELVPLALLTISFGLMANGAGLWGLLTADLSRSLGERTYSIYLLHGPLLFVTFRFLLGFEWVVQLSPVEYWSVIGLLTPLLLGLGVLSYRFIERPWILRTTDFTVRLRNFRIGKGQT